ncbi:hypothetical protein AB0D12_39240 [Streptomyces sp. NPDC048479]
MPSGRSSASSTRIAAALLEAQEGAPGKAHDDLRAAIQLDEEI